MSLTISSLLFLPILWVDWAVVFVLQGVEVTRVPAFSRWLGWSPGAVSWGISALLQGPVHIGVSSRAPPCVLSPQQERLGIPAVGWLGSKEAKQNLPDLLRARPGTGTESLHPVGQSRPRATPVQLESHGRCGRMGGIVGGRPQRLRPRCPHIHIHVRVACLHPHCGASPGPSRFHSQMNSL